MDAKADLRYMMKQKLAALDADVFKVQGFRAEELITASGVWKEARSVLSFVSASREISTRFLLEEALLSGKFLFVPKIIENDMFFFRIKTLVGPWDEGPFGILEPKADNTQQFQIEKVNFPLLVIVPGLAFDRKGHRIGRGKGYYDRFLSKMRTFSEKNAQNITIMGFCLAEQLIDHVPTEEFDEKMDVIYAGNDYIQIGS